LFEFEVFEVEILWQLALVIFKFKFWSTNFN